MKTVGVQQYFPGMGELSTFPESKKWAYLGRLLNTSTFGKETPRHPVRNG